MEAGTVKAIAGHDHFCWFQVVCSVQENHADSGIERTEQETWDEAGNWLDSGEICECHTADNGYEGFLAVLPGKCRCGCGEATKSYYKPGHDARHLSAVVAAATQTEYYDSRSLPEILSYLPTEALVRKALARLAK